MRRPFWQTLAWRLTLAFVLVAAAALGTVGFISAASTRSEFSALLGEQAREDLAAQVQAYVQAHGSLNGFRPAGQGPAAQGQGQGQPPRPGNPGGPRTDVPGDGFRFRTPWTVLDTGYRAVFGTPDLPAGVQVTGQRAAGATPVQVAGRTVAYLLPSGLRPRTDRRSEEFLARTTRAIAWAMLGAALLAALLGVLISRTLLRPLRELLGGIHALQRGEAPAALAHTRSDEFGEVLGAFGEMHADVLRNQQARRRLTADIAHDLNTPLSVISGTLEGILDGTFQSTPERLRRLQRETGNVARLVGDLRFLALADAGELQVSREPTDVTALIREAVAPFQELAAAGA